MSAGPTGGGTKVLICRSRWPASVAETWRRGGLPGGVDSSFITELYPVDGRLGI
jgi:hypothetical protein